MGTFTQTLILTLFFLIYIGAFVTSVITIRRNVEVLGKFFKHEPFLIRLIRIFRANLFLSLPLIFYIYTLININLNHQNNYIQAGLAVSITTVILISTRILANPSHFLNPELSYDYDSAVKYKEKSLGFLQNFIIVSFLMLFILIVRQFTSQETFPSVEFVINIKLNFLFSFFYLTMLFIGTLIGEYILILIQPIVVIEGYPKT